MPAVFGDSAINRLDMKSDPATLPPGTAQAIENMRFDTNGLTVRGGMARQFEAGTSIGTIFATTVYRPDGGTDRLAFAGRTQLYLFNPADRSVTAYAYPSGEIIETGDTVELIQATIGSGSTLRALFILRGWDKSVLKLNGSSVAVDTAVPQSGFGLFYQNRLTVNISEQELKISDYLDFATWTLLNQFQIERGGADYLVSLLPYQKDYVLIGARKKIFLAYFDPNLGTVNAYTGGLSNSSFLRLQTGEAGPVGREAWIEAAGFIWFVTDNGVYAFQPQLDNQLTVLGQPLSADILPLFQNLSATYAAGASVQRYGYRLYFALPISEDPAGISALTVDTSSASIGADLPLDLPVNLVSGGIATVTTTTPHDLKVGDVVLIANVASGGVNGEQTVTSTPDDNTFLFSVDTPGTVLLGTRATWQKLATRNNVIAVFNLNERSSEHPLGVWESIDRLPDGIYADWLRIADFGAQRRLWVIDAVNGPALYEEGDVDEIGDVLGGVSLPFDLPVDLSETNFASVTIPGRLLTRAYRWTDANGAFAYVRRVRASETRLVLDDGDAGSITTRVRTPDRTANETIATFTGSSTQPDDAVKQRIFTRGLEAEVEVQTTNGRPTLRAIEVQTLRGGEF